MTFGLKAGNESSNLHWKRFRYDAHLRVEYNRPPRKIKTSQLTMEYGGTCKPSTRPAHVRTLGKVYAANVTDPDGDNVRLQLRVRWGTGVWDSTLTTAKRSGSAFAMTLPTSIPHNTTLRLYARAYDGRNYGPWSSVDASPCYFLVNTTIPESPEISSTRYRQSDPSDSNDAWLDGVGQYGAFTLTAADSDVNRYRFGINGDPLPTQQIATTSGAPQTVQVLPEKPGVHFITAQALDQAGNASEVRTYQYRVRAGQGARAVWAFDEGPGAQQAGAVGPEHIAVLQGGGTLGAAGTVGTALELDGTTGHAVVDGHVADTSKPFTVSAWARLDEKGNDSAVVLEQAGVHHPGFSLYYSGHFDQWAVLQHHADDPADTSRARVLADAPVTVGRWTHLLASYDGGRIRLFVDGSFAGETAFSGGWSAQNETLIGAAQRSGEVKAFFPGAIDEVQLFDYAMVTEGTRVEQLYNKQRVREAPGRPAMAVFSLDEPAGSHEVAGVADNLPAVYEGDVAAGVEGVDGRALRLNGVDAYGHTTAGVINTRQSFSVSAWARLDKQSATSGGVIASQAGTHKPGFTLYYSRHFDRWAFNQYSANSPDAHPVRAMQPAGAMAQDGEWAHLTGVHDAEKDTLTLYVNGRAVDTTTLGGAFHASGRMQIGAGQFDGQVQAFFPGSI
ncbi:LamG domain-containing protein, partial [Streptomyces sp. ACA25]|uniref:LamG domain-containing protein n=1 Tax=Streptomyces sp. ACA25 TaxID=3022596 RepID=UPI0023072773